MIRQAYAGLCRTFLVNVIIISIVVIIIIRDNAAGTQYKVVMWHASA